MNDMLVTSLHMCICKMGDTIGCDSFSAIDQAAINAIYQGRSEGKGLADSFASHSMGRIFRSPRLCGYVKYELRIENNASRTIHGERAATCKPESPAFCMKPDLMFVPSSATPGMATSLCATVAVNKLYGILQVFSLLEQPLKETLRSILPALETYLISVEVMRGNEILNEQNYGDKITADDRLRILLNGKLTSAMSLAQGGIVADEFIDNTCWHEWIMVAVVSALGKETYLEIWFCNAEERGNPIVDIVPETLPAQVTPTLLRLPPTLFFDR